MRFCDRFSALREDSDLKQKDIAKLLNVSVSAVSHYEKGLNLPDIHSLILLSEFFDVSLDYLVGRSESRYPDSILNNNVKAPNNTLTYGEVIHWLKCLGGSEQNDIIRYLKVLYESYITKTEREGE